MCEATFVYFFYINVFIGVYNSRSSFPTSENYQWKNKEIGSGTTSKCDFEYEAAVSKCDSTRLRIESMIVDYNCRFQSCELERLTRLKSNITDVSGLFDTLSTVLSKNAGDVNLVLEMLDPVRQIGLISERDRTGSQRIPPIVYKNFYSGYKGKLFGVSLVDLAESTGVNVPGWLSRAIVLVERDCVEVAAGGGGEAWWFWTSQLLNVTGVHALRGELEGMGMSS
jgi:hypothetical protein